MHAIVTVLAVVGGWFLLSMIVGALWVFAKRGSRRRGMMPEGY